MFLCPNYLIYLTEDLLYKYYNDMNIFQIKIDPIMGRIILSFSLAKYTIVKVPFNSRKRLSNAKITPSKVSRLIQSI